MKPGRELDALVAEKVMMHKPKPVCSYGEYYRNFVSHNKIPEYSTDIAAAWAVVEKLGAVFSVVLVGTEWECYFELEKNDEHYGRGETAPLAICLAALRAVGEKVE